MARAAALATLALGLVSIAIMIGFGLLPEAQAAGGCVARGAVLQFELARNSADLARIFGAGDAGCGPRVIAAMDAVNTLDIFAYIPAYTAFAIAGALFLARGALRPLAVCAILAAVAAAAGDYLETITLLRITKTLQQPDALLPYSQLGAWSKFSLLAVHGVFCAGLCFLSEKRRPILGVLLLGPAIGVGLAAVDHVAYAELMTGLFALAWIPLLISAAMALLPERGAPA